MVSIQWGLKAAETGSEWARSSNKRGVQGLGRAGSVLEVYGRSYGGSARTDRTGEITHRLHRNGHSMCSVYKNTIIFLIVTLIRKHRFELF